MSYFQKIPDKHFDADASFLVKESRTMRLVIGMVVLVLAVFIIRGSVIAGSILLVVGIATIIISRKTQVIMTINKNGFFYYGNLITNWKNFVSAQFLDEAPTLTASTTGFSDQFFLALRYYKDNHEGCFERKFPLTNTQDKSEEEILAAIRFYSRNSRKQ